MNILFIFCRDSGTRNHSAWSQTNHATIKHYIPIDFQVRFELTFNDFADRGLTIHTTGRLVGVMGNAPTLSCL